MPDPNEPDAARTLVSLALQLERDRRAFLVGGAAYAVVNLVLVVLVWIVAREGALGWILAAAAFFANVFYAIAADWELRWEQVWRRAAPRLERQLGEGGNVLTPVLADAADARRLQRALKYVAWALSAVWLMALFVALAANGLEFRWFSG